MSGSIPSEPRRSGILSQESMNIIECIVEKLVKARKAYYNDSYLLMTDQQYDALEDTLRQLDPEHPFFETVGHSPSSSWKKATHNIFMGSLNKVHTVEDIHKWANKYTPDTLYSLQYKLDGLSVSLDYLDSEFIRGVTRGNGFKGDDITPNIKLMQGFKQTLMNFTGSLRAEIILQKDLFNKINNTLEEKDKYINPRSAASGISRGLEGLYCKYLNLIFYDILEPINEDAKLKRLKNLGLEIPFNVIGKTQDIILAFEKIKTIRTTIDYDIDGVVVKVNDYQIQVEQGSSQNKPRAQKAWKFDPPGAATTFIKEVWNVGRTGVVTPLALLEPIAIDGTTIQKATLHNIAEIKRLNIGRGDIVMLIKSGDIIPKINSILEHKGDPLQIPTKCPSCNSELKNDGTKLQCLSDNCSGKIFYRILNWITVVKIEDFGESLAEALKECGKLEKIIDLYKITKEDISSLNGWGEDSAIKIINNINNTRKLEPEIFLMALGIPGISKQTSQDLLKNFKTLDNLLQRNAEDIKNIKGYSDISANNIVSGLLKYNSEIKDLLKIIDINTQEIKGKLKGFSFCFTGEMKQSRSYYENIVKDNGGLNYSSVTKDLSYLVCNENKGSNKSIKAEKYGVKIITEDQFLQIIGIQLAPKMKIDTPSLF